MPSPFPGMDPYLEGSLWTTFHFAFGGEIVRQLAPRLRPRYLVLPVERFVIDTFIVRQLAPRLRPRYLVLPVERFVIDTFDDIAITANIDPDVDVAKSARETLAVYAPSVTNSPLHLATVSPDAVQHVSIEIRDTANLQLVTAIEILSPTNKRADGRVADSLLRMAGLRSA